MRTFVDDAGREWVASAREESTPRHFGRWHLIFFPEDAPERVIPTPEVRWQTRATAERTIRTMGEFELVRRLQMAKGRASADVDTGRQTRFPEDEAPVGT